MEHSGMNELIDKFGEEADLFGDCVRSSFVSGRYVGTINVSNIEKFAELIWEEAYQKGFSDGAEQAILKERG